jgi:hypothetical protein
VGEVKAARYMVPFLQAIREFGEKTGVRIQESGFRSTPRGEEGEEVKI